MDVLVLLRKNPKLLKKVLASDCLGMPWFLQLPKDKAVRSNAIELRGLLFLYHLLEVAECFIAGDVDGHCLAKKFAIMLNALHENCVLVIHGG